MTPGTGVDVPTASPNLSVSSEHAASAAFTVGWSPNFCSKWTWAQVSLQQVLHPSWMKSQLMFEVNISSKWARSKCCTWVGWSPNSRSKWTSARSELAASAALKLDEVPTHVRSEHYLSERATPCTTSWMKSQPCSKWTPKWLIRSPSEPQSSSEPRSKCCTGQVPLGNSSEPLISSVSLEVRG